MLKSAKQHFLDTFVQEHERTMRVLRAYPDEQSDLRLHARSRSAREVAWPLALGQERLMVKAVTTGFDWSAPAAAPPPPPPRMSEIATAVEEAHRRAREAVGDADEARLEAHVQFFVAPKTLGDVALLDFLWFLLLDHVHHRGQLSVYLRAVGKVPSIYGPSEDAPWR